MNQQLKAKIIIELMEERKYAVLSSLSDSEITTLNELDITNVTPDRDEVNNVISEFLEHIEIVKSASREPSSTDDTRDSADAGHYDEMPLGETAGLPFDVISEIADQPIQFLAFLVNHVDDNMANYIRNHLSEEKIQEIQTTTVESMPISGDVIAFLKDMIDID